MLWLDSSYPPEKAGTPGGDRGDCPQDSGVPADVESSIPNAYVFFYPCLFSFLRAKVLTNGSKQPGHLVQHQVRSRRLNRHGLARQLGYRYSVRVTSLLALV